MRPDCHRRLLARYKDTLRMSETLCAPPLCRVLDEVDYRNLR